MAEAAIFFDAIQPMVPLGKEVFLDSPGYIYQIKWDGVRILALIEECRVSLKNRRSSPRTAQYPELQKLAELIDATSAVLDGEVIVLAAGKPNFPRLLRRDLCRREKAVRALQRELPCSYCLFDLLFLNGADLTGHPLEQRQRLLEEIVKPAPLLHLCENFTEGQALYREIGLAGLEGIVAKKRGSLYRSGKRSADWLKMKPRRRQLCVVGGLSMSGGAVGSLLLGAYRGEELLYIGKAGAGLKGQELLQLHHFALQGASATSFFSNPPRERALLWLKPSLTVLIEFAEWTGTLKMRHPVVLGFSGRSPEEAVI